MDADGDADCIIASLDTNAPYLLRNYGPGSMVEVDDSTFSASYSGTSTRALAFGDCGDSAWRPLAKHARSACSRCAHADLVPTTS